jgi:hypothetical protein
MIGPINLFDVTDWRDPSYVWGKTIPIDWIIIGGESGPKDKVRAMPLVKAYGLLEQAHAADIPVYVKQMGTFFADFHRNEKGHLRSTKGENIEEWPPELRVQEFPVILEADDGRNK